jgi:hypothetical protein
MKFAVASYGTRGDIESCAAVGLELPRAGSGMARPAGLGRCADDGLDDADDEVASGFLLERH